MDCPDNTHPPPNQIFLKHVHRKKTQKKSKLKPTSEFSWILGISINNTTNVLKDFVKLKQLYKSEEKMDWPDSTHPLPIQFVLNMYTEKQHKKTHRKTHTKIQVGAYFRVFSDFGIFLT